MEAEVGVETGQQALHGALAVTEIGDLAKAAGSMLTADSQDRIMTDTLTGLQNDGHKPKRHQL